MLLYHIIILAIVQGLTEFLPVSSSGHLVLTHYLLGNSNSDLCWTQNRLMDVAVHVGTLLSVLFYFYKDIMLMIGGVFKPQSEGFGLSKNIIIASLPVIIAGFIIQQFQFSFLCLLQTMAWMTLIFGIVLWWADKYQTGRNLIEMRTAHAFIIGLSQILALIPGVSRSGITMTSARFLGFSRVEAAKFSLLLSIIAISGAGVLSSYDLLQTQSLSLGQDVIIAVILSFIAGWISIWAMMKWLAHASFKPFAVYRIILGVALLGLTYSGIL